MNWRGAIGVLHTVTHMPQNPFSERRFCRPGSAGLRRHGGHGCRRLWLGIVVVCLLSDVSRAQGSEVDGARVGAPFSTVNTAGAASEGAQIAWELELADSALRAGFHALAVRLYEPVISRTAIEASARRRAVLGRIDALLAQGNSEEAAAALNQFAGERDGAWRVRRALAYFQEAMVARAPERIESAYVGMGEMLRDLRPEVLGREAPWLYFLRGIAASRIGDASQADGWFERAVTEARSEAERAVLRLSRFQHGLASGERTEAAAAALLANIERQQGKTLALQFTLPYAVVLDSLGDKARAVAVLKRQCESLPPGEIDLRDQTLLLLGLIAGASAEEGRSALRELLERGRDADFQRVALMRLASAARMETGVGGTGELKRLLTALLDRPDTHPLTEDLLFFRAELSLRVRAFEEAENDARAVLTRFPGSVRLRRESLALLASSSWQRPPRYRTAADYIGQILALPDLTSAERARLSLLQGECHYRAGIQDNTIEDFRNAAQAYGMVMDSGIVPEGMTAGTIFFQRVVALIDAREIDTAARLLDDPLVTGRVDAESRWQAEWNLARELQLLGRSVEALRRADSLGPTPGVPAGLRLRFLWLAAQVSLEIGPPGDTEARVARVREFVQGPQAVEIPPERRSDVLSNAGLVAAEARLRAGDREAARTALDQLRAEFPASPAADYSYIVEAGFLAGENRLVEAMQLLSRFADERPDGRYAPEALYQAALMSIQRGQKEHLDEANRLLERMADRYRNGDYVYQARLKQAEVKLSLGSFSEAEAIYRSLEDQFPSHASLPLVQVSLAGALMAQASVEPGKFDGAVSRFERLMANETLPADLRAEAGVRLAEGWQAQGNPARAAEIAWEVYHRFVEQASAISRLGATGPSWISRAIFLLGEEEERAGRAENARRLYQSLLDHGLPGDKVARARMARLLAPVGSGG